MGKLPKRALARTPDREGPGLIVRLRPRRMFLIAADFDEQREVEKLARAVSALLDLVEPEVAA